MALFDAETEVTLTDGTTANTVQIIISSRITHNWDKPDLKIRPLPFKLQSDTYTMLIDLGMNKFVITVDGYIRDDDTVSAETRLAILETLFNKTTDIQMYWGSNATSRYPSSAPAVGGISKVDVRELIGRQDVDSSARLRRGGTCSVSPTTNTSKDTCGTCSVSPTTNNTQSKCTAAGGSWTPGTWTAYGKTYEVTVAFVIGNNRAGG